MIVVDGKLPSRGRTGLGPAQHSAVLGDIGDREVCGCGTERGGEGCRVAPFAGSQTATDIFHLHLIVGVGGQVGERVGRGYGAHRYPFAVAGSVLHFEVIAFAGPIQGGGVGGDGCHVKVFGGVAGNIGGEGQFFAQVAQDSTAVGDHLHGVFRPGIQPGERVRILIDIEHADVMVVDVELPNRCRAVLSPAYHGTVFGDIGDCESRGRGTDQRGEGHQVTPVAEAVGAAVVLHLHLVVGAGCQTGERVG